MNFLEGFDEKKMVIPGSQFKWEGKEGVKFAGEFPTGTIFTLFPDTESASDEVKIYKGETLVVCGYLLYYIQPSYGWTYVGNSVPQLAEIPLDSHPPVHLFERRPIPYEKLGRVSYRKLEGYARNSEAEFSLFLTNGHLDEAAGCLGLAQHWRNRAKLAMPLELSLEQEEKALDSGNVLSIAVYNSLSSGDRSCWELRGLEKFVHYTQFSEVYYWYE